MAPSTQSIRALFLLCICKIFSLYKLTVRHLNFFNKEKVSNDKTRNFDPIGWSTDMAGIFNVFGEEVKSCIKSCELHFKKQRKKMAEK